MNTATAAVPFFLHDLGQPELDEVARVLAGPLLTTGETVDRLEERFAAFMGRRHALGVTSCTGAMHMSLIGLGVGPGHEVITTPVTFIATATAIVEAGARPVFVDVEPDTGNMDAARIEAAITPRTRAILPVHLYGQMCDMRAIRAVAERHGLFVVEDCAHCVLGNRDGYGPGELADTACFSFYATKELTCGEGGAVITDDPELAAKLRLIRLHGMTKTAADRWREGYKPWDMVTFGWKYNMDNIQAALVLPQLDRLARKWEHRHSLAALYQQQLADVPGISWPRTLPGVKHAHYVFPILVGDGRRDELLDGLQAEGIGVAVQFRAIHQLTYFRETCGYQRGDLPVAESFGDRVICLPFYPGMPEAHVEVVSRAIRRLMAR